MYLFAAVTILYLLYPIYTVYFFELKPLTNVKSY